MTTKLYWNDSHLKNFEARVFNSYVDGEKQIVILDQTAFYPTGGGQPCDLGTINGIRVCDVSINDDGTIFHTLESGVIVNRDEVVNCDIDWARRLELMQQHTGQHILSQAFFQLFGAETRGFRINSTSSEIDLMLDASPEQMLSRLQQAEDLANEIVFANRAIRIHQVTPEDAAKLPLRKETFVDDCVRIIEIEDYDWSACGGTHAMRTGEVGIITIKNWERAKQMIRVEFLCGVRALRDYRIANATADAIARQFSVARDNSVESVSRLIEENKQLKRRTRMLAEVAVKFEAEEIRGNSHQGENATMIISIFDDRSFDELKLLAHELVKSDSVIALLAVKEQNVARLVFARSNNLNQEMGQLMREACQLLGGKGGGTPDFAQGGGTDLANVEAILKQLSEKIAK